MLTISTRSHTTYRAEYAWMYVRVCVCVCMCVCVVNTGYMYCVCMTIALSAKKCENMCIFKHMDNNISVYVYVRMCMYMCV